MITTNLQLIRRTDNVLYQNHEFLKTLPDTTVVTMTVKKNLDDTESLFTAAASVNFVTGDFTIPVTAENTTQDRGIYYYDIVATTADSKRYLIGEGKLEIELSASSMT